MSFSPQFLDEIRARVSLAETIGKRVRLTRRGREHVGLCPFHNEKTPSFTVSEDKGFFHCFGCGEHGDVIGFAMRTDNLTFPEAVERLANSAGLSVPQSTPEDAERARERTSLYTVLETACTWFEEQLANKEGTVGRDYLACRGLDADTIVKFRLGWAPSNRSALKRELAGRGISEAMMDAVGLIGTPDGGGDAYDRFRGRIIFPITDRRGRVVAFGGRAVGDAKPKYLNSPETALFHKGAILYGESLARKAAREVSSVVVVEGYMDVIALHRAGFENAVATLGTALTETQILELWRLVREPIVCFDGDDAGLSAAFRAIDKVLPMLRPGNSLRFALLPRGQDPDSLIEAHGKEAMRRALDQAFSFDGLLWNRIIQGVRLKTTDDRIRLEDKINKTIGKISNPSVQKHYKKEMISRMWKHFSAVFKWKRGEAKDKIDYRGETVSPLFSSQASEYVADVKDINDLHYPFLEIILIAGMIVSPRLIGEFAEEFSKIDIYDDRLSSIRSALIEMHGREDIRTKDDVLKHLESVGLRQGVNEWVLEKGIVMTTRCLRIDATEPSLEELIGDLIRTFEALRMLGEERAVLEEQYAVDETDKSQKKLQSLQREFLEDHHDDRRFYVHGEELRQRLAARAREREHVSDVAHAVGES